MKTMHVRVKRAFYYNGAPTKVDAIIEVPVVFGTELMAAKKAEAVEAPPKAVIAGDDANNDDGKNASRDAKGGRNAR